MRDDNTPTVTSRRRKPTPHQRVRLQKAKDLKKIGALTKKKRADAKMQKPRETDPEKMVSLAPRIPKLKKDILAKPTKPPAKFRKRQIHKSWLPTHMYHAKRAHMTPPKEPLWRFAIPLTPTDKSYRLTHRATSSRGSVAWDMSYMSTIGIDGVEPSLLGLLRSVGVAEDLLTGNRNARWRKGTRGWEGWIRQRDGERRWIAKVGIIWCIDSSSVEHDVEAVQKNSTEADMKETPEVETSSEMHAETPEETAPVMETGSNRAAVQSHIKPIRKLLLRVHPSAFLQVWNEVLKVAKIQRPQVKLEDLRFEIGSIEITGPGSTEALIGALHPVRPTGEDQKESAVEGTEHEWADIETPEKVWPQLVAVSNPASLPTNALLAFNVSDPRLQYPPRTAQLPKTQADGDTLLEMLSSWPPDQTLTSPNIFDRTKRLAASRSLASQKAINRRKGDAPPGAYPDPKPNDPSIPVLLLASRVPTKGGQGSWTVLLPWECVLPVWYSLMHYPLSIGGNPRFGGLLENRQLSFEQNMPWFPGDYPGTEAGFQWELLEREKKKQEWERRPKGKRTEWDSLDLGEGRKGEIGLGWACDWERLLQGPPPRDVEAAEKRIPTASEKATASTSKCQESRPATKGSQPEQPLTECARMPLNIHYLPNHPSKPPVPSSALAPVHLILITSGHPTRNARLYRLPTKNADLRAKWLALARPAKPSNNARGRHPPPKSAPEYARAQHLASTLLSRPISSSTPAVETSAPKAGDPAYPVVPDEIDLVGFVTTGNYHLGEGRCEAIGNVAVARVLEDADGKGGVSAERTLCIVREVGQALGRLARWRFV